MYQAVDVPCSLHERGFCVREKPCTHASVLDLSRSPFLCLCRSVLGHSILVPVPKSNIDTAIIIIIIIIMIDKHTSIGAKKDKHKKKIRK